MDTSVANRSVKYFSKIVLLVLMLGTDLVLYTLFISCDLFHLHFSINRY